MESKCDRPSIGIYQQNQETLSCYNNNTILESIIDVFSSRFFIHGPLVRFMPEVQPRLQKPTKVVFTCSRSILVTPNHCNYLDTDTSNMCNEKRQVRQILWERRTPSL